jgi:hypothetical protein
MAIAAAVWPLLLRKSLRVTLDNVGLLYFVCCASTNCRIQLAYGLAKIGFALLYYSGNTICPLTSQFPSIEATPVPGWSPPIEIVCLPMYGRLELSCAMAVQVRKTMQAVETADMNFPQWFIYSPGTCSTFICNLLENIDSC